MLIGNLDKYDYRIHRKNHMTGKIARSILAVTMSLVVMFILTGIFFQILMTVMPELKPTPEQIESGEIPYPPPGVTMIVLLFDLAIATIGGVLSAAIPVDKPVHHTTILSIMILALGIVTLTSTWRMEPIWYALMRTGFAPVFVFGGGWFWAKKRSDQTSKG
jgi:hypothetical protein